MTAPPPAWPSDVCGHTADEACDPEDLAPNLHEVRAPGVNSATRLCAAVVEDEILAAETTLRGIEELFETEPMPRPLLNGKPRARGRQGAGYLFVRPRP